MTNMVESIDIAVENYIKSASEGLIGKHMMNYGAKKARKTVQRKRDIKLSKKPFKEREPELYQKEKILRNKEYNDVKNILSKYALKYKIIIKDERDNPKKIKEFLNVDYYDSDATTFFYTIKDPKIIDPDKLSNTEIKECAAYKFMKEVEVELKNYAKTAERFEHFDNRMPDFEFFH